MGSVNRDFVFRELQAGKQTHNSHMDAHTDIQAREGGGAYMAGYILYSHYAEKRSRTCGGYMHTRTLT